MFYGIVIRMYFYDDKQHHTPHVYAEYSDEKAVFGGVGGTYESLCQACAPA